MTPQKYNARLIACAICLPAIAVAALSDGLRAMLPGGVVAVVDFCVFGPVAAAWKLIAS